ncbi:ABC transporter permease [Streptococcus caprae]|uniref:ABC transporter permease n=1 Tax=Streptococcus caprae TaxID=1640501 RepID=A0ABV8CUG8_9STRE
MKAIFDKRRSQFLSQLLKYSRYVFNDHFVLVLLVLAGFLMVQYRHLLENFPKVTWPVLVVLVLALVLVFSVGRLGTYIEPADHHFLLAKEVDLLSILNQAFKRSWGLWGSIQTVLIIMLAPILKALGLAVWQIGLLILLALGIRYLLLKRQQVKFVTEYGGLEWDRAIAFENKRKQSILTFFSLFTTVKGITTSTKRRAYLDGILEQFGKKSKQTWLYLYARAYFRSGDYLALTLRLLILSLLVLLFVEQKLLAAGLVLILNYLLLFQLLALFHHYDYHYLTGLFPQSESDKARELQSFLRVIGYGLTLLEVCFAMDIKAIGLILIGMIVICEGYLRFKLSKMIDEVL